METLKNRNDYYNASNVKEVSIVSHYIFMMSNDYWYKDLLRISKNRISYRRNSFRSGDIRSEWSYKTTTDNRLWDSLTSEIISTFDGEKPFIQITDSGSFNLRVTFKNDEHWDLDLSVNFSFNKLSDLALLIKRMIPSDETEYPDVLDVIPLFLYEQDLTKENLKDVKKQDFCALMYAEGGAMGLPGEVCIIDTHQNKLFNNGICSDKEYDISQIEVLETYFDGFKHIDGYLAPDFATYQLNEKSWKYINLGYGNHLYLRNDFWYEHGDRIMSVDASERYVKWKKLIKEQ